MILDDDLIQRVHQLAKDMLARVSQGVAQVREDAAWTTLGTGFGLYAGEGSPLTQVTGFAHLSKGDLTEIETFFDGRARHWEVSITPFTHPDTIRSLLGHGYEPASFEGHLIQTIGDIPPGPEIEIEEMHSNLSEWMEASWRAWTENETSPFEADEITRSLASVPGRRYLARMDGVPAAAASLYEFDDAVVLGGAATRLPYRNRGIQNALLLRRLRDAGRGRLAMMGAVPGSSSHRNAQRAGFETLYSSLTLTRMV